MSLDIKTAESIASLLGLTWHTSERDGGKKTLDKFTCFYCTSAPDQLLLYSGRQKHAWLACNRHAEWIKQDNCNNVRLL